MAVLDERYKSLTEVSEGEEKTGGGEKDLQKDFRRLLNVIQCSEQRVKSWTHEIIKFTLEFTFDTK